MGLFKFIMGGHCQYTYMYVYTVGWVLIAWLIIYEKSKNRNSQCLDTRNNCFPSYSTKELPPCNVPLAADVCYWNMRAKQLGACLTQNDTYVLQTHTSHHIYVHVCAHERPTFVLWTWHVKTHNNAWYYSTNHTLLLLPSIIARYSWVA